MKGQSLSPAMGDDEIQSSQKSPQKSHSYLHRQKPVTSSTYRFAINCSNVQLSTSITFPHGSCT